VVAMLAAIGVVEHLTIRQLSEADGSVTRTEAARHELERAVSEILEVDAMTRGYAATGQEALLRELEPSISDAKGYLATLRGLVADNPRQLRNADELNRLAGDSIAFGNSLVAIRRTRGATAAAASLEDRDQHRLEDAIQTLRRTMEAEAESLVQSQRIATEVAVLLANRVSAMGTFAALVMLLLAGRAIFTGLRRRRDAENRLRAEQNLTEAVLESLHEGLVACGTDGNLIRLNRAAGEIYGRRSGPMSIEEWTTLVDRYSAGSDVPLKAGELPLYRALQGESLVDFEMKVVPKNGLPRVVLANAQPIRDSQGAQLGAVVAMHDITEKREAAARLLESEALYSSVVSAMAEGVVIHEPDGAISAYNDAALRILDLTADQLQGRTAMDLASRTIRSDGSPFPGEEYPATVTLRTGQAQANVVMGICKADGSVTWILINTEPVDLGADNRRRQSVVATFIDITDLRRAEDALRRSEEDLQEAQATAHIGSWARNAETDVLVWSGELYRIKSCDPALPPPSDEDIFREFDDESAARLQVVWRELLDNGTPYETDLLMADGVTWVTARGAVERDAAGTVIRWHGTIQDITERKAAEQKLAAYAAELDDLYNHAPCGYHSIDDDGMVVLINDTELAMLGYERDEIVGKKRLLDLMTEKYAKEFPVHFATFKETGHCDHFESELRRKNGTIMSVVMSATAVVDAQGRFVRTRAALLNVTDTKKADDARRHAEEALRASEMRYRLFVERSPIGILRTSGDGTILDCNTSFARILGFEAAGDLNGHSMQEFWWDLADRRSAMELLASQKMLANHEVRLRRRDGRQLWAAITINVVEDDPAGILTDGTIIDITERKEAEARLAASAAELDDLYNHAPCGYHSIDEAGRFVRINDTSLAMFGYDREDVIGKMAFFDVATEKCRQQFELNRSTLMATGKLRNVEVEFLRKDGTILPALLNVTAAYNQDGTFSVARSTVVDITDLKKEEAARLRAEETLRASEQRYRRFVERNPAGILRARLDGTILECNAAMARMGGFSSPGELVGLKTPEFFFEPESRTAMLERLQVEKVLVNHELRLQAHCGRPKWAAATITLVEDDPSGAVLETTIIDITERKEAEEKLAAYTAELDDLYNHAPCGYHTIDENGVIVRINDTELAMLGYEREELVGRNAFTVLVTEEGRKPHGEAYAGFVKAGHKESRETELIRRDGTILTVSVQAVAIRDADGKFVESRASLIDITERKELEAARLRVEETLRAAERRSRRFVERNPAGVTRVRLDGTLLEYNDAFARLVGFDSHQDLAGRKLPDFWWDPAERPEMVARLRAEKALSNYEIRFRKCDGQPIWISLTASLVEDDPADVHIEGFLTDITERKEAEQKLAANAAELDDLYNHAPCGYHSTDEAGNLVRVNDTWLAMLGYERAEFTGKKTFFDVTTEKSGKQFLANRPRLIGAGRLNNVEVEFVRKDGTIVPAIVNVTAVYDQAGIFTSSRANVFDLTEQKKLETARLRAEDAVKASEERLNLALDAAQLGIWELDLASDTYTRNLRHDQIFGHPSSQAEWSSEIFLNRVLADDRDTVQKEFDEALAAGKLSSEFRIVWPDKSIHWISAQGHVFRDGQDRPAKVVGIIADVTERKRAEEELRASEARYRAVVEDQSEWICRYLPDTTFTFMNDSFAGFFGVSEERTGGTFTPMILPEDLPRVKTALASVSREHPAVTIENRVYDAQGEIRWGQFVNRAIFDSNGRIAEFQAVGRDITDRKSAESALQESEAAFRILTDAMPQIVWINGPDGSGIYCNQRWVDYTGLTKEQSDGRGWNALFHPDDQYATWNAWSHALTTGETYTVESRLRDLDGRYRWFLLRAVPQRDTEGRIVKWFGTCTDINDMKKAEEELAKYRAHLEDIVTELSHSLAEKEVLLKEIHHRVKNNLQIVSSLLHMQGRQTTDQATKELLRESENRIQSMGAIHESLYQTSDFSRVDLSQYLRRVVNRVAASYQRPQVACGVTREGDTVVTMEIAMPCGLIVNELVSNALKHAFHDGAGQVNVTVRRDARTLTLAVHDNGSGLPDGFEIENARGLGLQLVRTLTSQLSGAVRVIGGGGSTFEIEFAVE